MTARLHSVSLPPLGRFGLTPWDSPSLPPTGALLTSCAAGGQRTDGKSFGALPGRGVFPLLALLHRGGHRGSQGRGQEGAGGGRQITPHCKRISTCGQTWPQNQGSADISVPGGPRRERNEEPRVLPKCRAAALSPSLPCSCNVWVSNFFRLLHVWESFPLQPEAQH